MLTEYDAQFLDEEAVTTLDDLQTPEDCINHCKTTAAEHDEGKISNRSTDLCTLVSLPGNSQSFR